MAFIGDKNIDNAEKTFDPWIMEILSNLDELFLYNILGMSKLEYGDWLKDHKDKLFYSQNENRKK